MNVYSCHCKLEMSIHRLVAFQTIFRMRAFTWEDDLSAVKSSQTDATLFGSDTRAKIFPLGQSVSTQKCVLINYYYGALTSMFSSV